MIQEDKEKEEQNESGRENEKERLKKIGKDEPVKVWRIVLVLKRDKMTQRERGGENEIKGGTEKELIDRFSIRKR